MEHEAVAQLDSLISKHDLTARRADIMRLVRPSVRIRRTPTTQEALGPTTSRFGGQPHLPDGVEWPKGRSGPMMFLAMVECSAAAKFDVEGQLPKTGLLYFWYDNLEGRWGFDPKDRECFAVTYEPSESAPLQMTAFPGTSVEYNESHMGNPNPDGNAFAPCSLEFEHGLTLPNGEWVRHYVPELTDATEENSYYYLMTELDDGDTQHRLGGHATPCQGPMETECQLVSNGLYCGDTSGYQDPRAEELRKGSLHWQLLLQIDSDEEGPGWLWGDCGRLYFWIRKQDRAERRFDRCWQILQCY